MRRFSPPLFREGNRRADNRFRAALQERFPALPQSRPCGAHVVHQQDPTAADLRPGRYGVDAGDIGAAEGRVTQSGLGRIVPPLDDEPLWKKRVQRIRSLLSPVPADALRQEPRLIEPPLPEPFPADGNPSHRVKARRIPLRRARCHKRAQRFRRVAAPVELHAEDCLPDRSLVSQRRGADKAVRLRPKSAPSRRPGKVLPAGGARFAPEDHSVTEGAPGREEQIRQCVSRGGKRRSQAPRQSAAFFPFPGVIRVRAAFPDVMLINFTHYGTTPPGVALIPAPGAYRRRFRRRCPTSPAGSWYPGRRGTPPDGSPLPIG